MTWPCRSSMKLCNVLILSAASTKVRTALDEIPCASGVLRGSGSAAWARKPVTKQSEMLNGRKESLE